MDDEEDGKTYTVQTGWKGFCKNSDVDRVVRAYVPVLTRAISEAWLLLNAHVIHMANERKDLSVFENQMLFYNALVLTFKKDSTVGKKRKDCCEEPDLHRSTFEGKDDLLQTYRMFYMQQFPPSYVKQSRPRGDAFSRMMNAAAKMMQVNFKNHISVHFESRHERYIRLMLRRTGIDFFSTERSMASAIRMVKALTLYDVHGTVLERIDQYPILKETATLDAVMEMDLLASSIKETLDRPNVLACKILWTHHVLKTFEDEAEERIDVEHPDWLGSDVRIRLFAMTPGGSFQPSFVQVDYSILRAILGPDAPIDRGLLFQEVFHVHKVLHLDQETFGERSVQSVKTDGCGVSVVLKRPRQEPENPIRIPNFHSVVAVDPGRIDLVRFGEIPDDLDGLHGIITDTSGISSKTFYSKAGYTRRTTIVHRDMESTPAISGFNRAAFSPKTAYMHRFRRRVSQVLRSIVDLVDFHGRPKYVRLRRHVSIMKKKVVDEICTRISGGSRSTVVAFGDGDVNAGGACKGLKGPAKAIRRRLRTHHCFVFDVDEFRTSMVCSKCCHMLDRSRPRVCRKWDQNGILSMSESHVVRVCSNPLCRTIWDRDVNAVRNIGMKFLSMIHDRALPDVFFRVNSGGRTIGGESPVPGVSIPVHRCSVL